MKSIRLLCIAAGVSAAAWGQNAPAGPRQGPGVQAPQDARYADLIKTCKVAPPGRGGRGGQGKGAPAAAAPGPRPYSVTAIPGVIAAGEQWKEVWKVEGNNADGIIGTSDGGLLIAQNDNSDVVKLDKNGKTSIAYKDTNTGGSVARNSKGALFLVSRGLNQSVEQLEPKRRKFAEKFNGDPIDCIGGVMNDLTADSKGGVYFTMGGVFYADPKGTITRYGMNLNTNGIVLSADEKRLFVTNGATVAEFDVQPDGSLTNQREFAKLEGGGFGDGSTFDTAGRLYVTTNPGVQVIGPDGKYLGIIPTPRPVISVAFGGAEKKTLYVLARGATTGTGEQVANAAQVYGIQMIAQGYKGRAK